MSSAKQTLSIYWQHTRKFKKQLWFIYPAIFIAMLSEDFIEPILISGILDKLAQNNLEALQGNTTWWIFAAIIALEGFSHIMWNFIVRFVWRTQERIMLSLNMAAFDHLQKMSYGFFANRFAGSLVNQVNKFVRSFERFTDPLTWNVYKLLVSLLLTSIVLFQKAPIVALAIIIISIIYAPIIWLVRKKQIPLTTKWSKAETERTGQLADMVSNVIAVKSFSNENKERQRMLKRVSTVYNRSIDTMKLNMTQELGTGAIQRSINISVIVLSVILAVHGTIQVGTIYLSLTFSIAIMRRLFDLSNTFRNFTRVFGDARDMTDIFNIEPEVKDPEHPQSFNPKLGAVDFNNVTFSYQDSRANVKLFNKLNLHIKSGEKIGLVGPSGGGKTTITKLLLRFMDIQSGSINIDNQDISKVRQSDLRKYISYVPQEPLLFHRSLSENINYGNIAATPADTIAASKNAHAHEFIKALGEGYDTLVGERGVKLSGGQKQRVAIARAMIKDAPLLVLDEATSALDSESEQLIQNALWKLMEGKTAIVIAHRLSTIQKMDRIIVLDEGKITEEGSHEQLLKSTKGVYARLWKHQSGGFIQE